MIHRLPFFQKNLAVLASFALLTCSFAKPEANNNQSAKIAAEKESTKYLAADFTQVAKEAIPAVVSIQVQNKQRSSLRNKQDLKENFDFFGGNEDLWELFGLPKKDALRSPPAQGQASGVIVSPDGYILTNSHVVHNMDLITVLMHDGRELSAKVLGDDPNTDLALVKIDADNLPFLELGDSDALEVGQWVAAVGNPFGMQATMTAGIVSAKNRSNLDIAHYEDFIQTDAAINRGNSGGPLLTLHGKIVGINTAIATNASAGYMGIGFAVPSNVAKHLMDEILSDGKISHGFLGITLQTIDYNLAQAFHLKKVGGALVSSVVEGSPAQQAGIKVADIITKINQKEISSAAALRNSVYIMKPGSKVVLTLLRDNKLMEIPVTIADYKETPFGNHSSQKTDLGMEVETLTAELARSLGHSGESGVVITKVDPNSAAAFAGIKKGALILGVNREKVSNLQQFNAALAKTEKDRPVLFQIKQGNQFLFFSLRTQ